MYFYHSKTTNPYFNIAAEEYLLKNYDADFFVLYLNEPSIIVGKHQNTLAEINVPYVMENQLKVVRRLSGGGTVFHDLGNLNYCFIQKGAQGQLVDFKKYSQPVLDTLRQMEVNAYLRGKSDLVIDDLKFSGNAEHVYRNKVLHHGTMLFQSELTQLNEAIRNDWSKFSDKAVRSNRSKVTNISAHLKTTIALPEFIEKVKSTVFNQQTDIQEFELTPDDTRAIEQLVNEKYQTWAWNFAYSPTYHFSKSDVLDNFDFSISFNVEKGRMQNLKLTLDKRSLTALEQLLTNQPHDYLLIKEKLSLVYSTFNFSVPLEEFIRNFF